MSYQYTPGPWYSEAFDTANGTAESVFAMIDETPVEICDVTPDHPDGGVANARLIMAAPEMLAALKDLVANQEAGWRADGKMPEEHIQAMPYLRLARAAILKAEGGA